MDRMDRQPCEIDLENMKASILTFSQKRNIQRRKRITCCSGEKKHAQKWGRTHHWLVSQTPQYGCDFLETPTVISGKFMKLPCIRYVEYIFFEQSYFKLSKILLVSCASGGGIWKASLTPSNITWNCYTPWSIGNQFVMFGTFGKSFTFLSPVEAENRGEPWRFTAAIVLCFRLSVDTAISFLRVEFSGDSCRLCSGWTTFGCV